MNGFALSRVVRAGTALLLLGTASPALSQSRATGADTTASSTAGSASGTPRSASPQHRADQRSEERRQAEPQRQPEPHRQQSPRTTSAWHDVGPAWRPVGPAWSKTTPAWSGDGRTQVVTPRPGQDAFRAAPDTYAPRGGRDRGDGRRRGPKPGVLYPSIPYVAVPYGVAPYYPSAWTEVPGGAPGAITEATKPSEIEEGFLRLRVRPRTAEVYVDGAYAGTVDDFGGSGERLLSAGPHRIELAARGYERVTFDVRVPARDTVTFTRDLDQAAPISSGPVPEPAPLTPIVHKRMYIIPGCYAGDTPPNAADLPASCRLANLKTID